MRHAARPAREAGADHAGNGATPAEFRTALRKMVAPVSVVTTLDGERPWGMTVSAFTVVCLDPPTMAVCVDRHTATATHILNTGRLGISLLNDQQVELSQRCAAPGVAKHLDPDDLIADDPIGEDGERPIPMPVLASAVVAFDCQAEPLEVTGSHLLVLARVKSVSTGGAHVPLLYGDGTYQRPCSIASPTD